MFSFFSERCYNGGKKHNFHPRVTKETKLPEKFTAEDLTDIMRSAFVDEEVEAIEAVKDRKEIYHGDVCTWCGTVVNKP